MRDTKKMSGKKIVHLKRFCKFASEYIYKLYAECEENIGDKFSKLYTRDSHQREARASDCSLQRAREGPTPDPTCQ